MKQTDDAYSRITELKRLLIWEGRLNRSRVVQLFGLGKIRASQWIREFRDSHPGWVYWDSKTRSFYATAEPYRNLDRSQYAESLAKYLALVGLPSASQSDYIESVVWTAFPDISIPPPHIFATLNNAIRMKRVVEITYMSMGTPTPHQRIISPHSLVKAGRRWHTRAYSKNNQQFRDYALGRITDVAMLGQDADPEHGVERDEAWTTEVPVQLVAHPYLSSDQQKVIRQEYFNGTSGRTDTCRGALVAYFIQDLRAAIDTAVEKPPEYQLAVENIKEVLPWIFPR